MKTIAVLLSGCGVFDGAEIHESVLTMLALSQAGAAYQCFAPDIAQAQVVNHLTGQVEPAQHRNVLVEAARIARGEIKATTALDISAYDGLIIPGGFGAAKNLCDFADNGADCQVHPLVRDFIQQFVAASKPIGFICIAPVMIPQLFGQGAKGTIGQDAETAAAFTAMGESTALLPWMILWWIWLIRWSARQLICWLKILRRLIRGLKNLLRKF